MYKEELVQTLVSYSKRNL